MFIFFWVLLRVALIFGTIFMLSLFLVLRGMARQVSKDQRLGLTRKNGGPKNLKHHILGVAITIVVVLGVRRHQWNAVVAGCAIAIGVIGIAWLDKVWEGAISRALLALFERGPASEDLWFRAAAPVGIVLLLDTFITGEWRFSPGLGIALVWCLAWGFLTRRFRQRSELQAHF